MIRASLLLVLCGLFLGRSSAAAASSRPNIIFILADDLGYGDLGSYGQKFIRTPALDRMAAEGMLFRHCYAGSTVCAPSRSVLMTGQHTGRTRVRGNARLPLRPQDRTIAEILQEQGYRTALIGKWGLGEHGSSGYPTRKGFDYFYGYANQRHAHNYYPTFLYRNDEKVPLQNVVTNEDKEGAGVASKKVEYTHDLFEREALEFITRSKDKPFFLYLAVTLPHANNEAKEKGMEIPSLGEYAEKDWPPGRKGHAAMVTRLDTTVGLLLQKLKELQLDENTIVFFSSDNGPHKEGGYDPESNNSNGELRGIKRDLYDGGIRVPMIVRWPGKVPAGKVNDFVWGFVDFLPTGASLAGAKKVKTSEIDGVDVTPVLPGKKEKVTRKTPLYWEFYERPTGQAVRDGNWKAVAVPFGGMIQLFDLSKDPSEQHDISADHPAVVGRMHAIMEREHIPSPDWKFPSPEAPEGKKRQRNNNNRAESEALE
jgi:arylsulfatase A-like enzyme